MYVPISSFVTVFVLRLFLTLLGPDHKNKAPFSIPLLDISQGASDLLLTTPTSSPQAATTTAAPVVSTKLSSSSLIPPRLPAARGQTAR